MKYSLKITPVALSDIKNGVKYYNSQRNGLGERFASVVNNTMSKIQKMPLAASIAYNDVRYHIVPISLRYSL